MSHSYVDSLGTLRTLGDFKFNLVLRFQGFESFTLDAGVVNTYLLPIFTRNESVPFLLVGSVLIQ